MDQALETARMHHEPGWARAYPPWCAVLQAHELRTGSEIGVAFGGHSEFMLENAGLRRLYSVDMFRHDPSYEDPLNFSQELFDELFRFVQGRLARFGDRSELVHAESADATARIPDGLDFVYIDANHSFEGVARDLSLWASKVRDGGLIGGHDYGHPNFPGVRQAIDQFVGRFGWQIHEEGEGVWWTLKQRLRISFIVPTYNCQMTIEDSIASITTDNLNDGDEIVVVDDDSEDDTPRILDGLRRANPRITILRHRHNRGTAAAARNTGIETASNPLIFCLDHDNLLASRSIEPLVRRLFTSGAGAAAFGEIHYFQASAVEITHKWVFKPEVTLADALSGIIWPGPSGNYLFTQESWLRAGRYPEPYLENRSLDSWMFAIRQLGTGSRLVTLPGTWYFHRYGHESHYVQNWRRGNQSLAALIALVPFLDQIETEDVEYLFGKEARYDWYDRLKDRPIRVKMSPPGQSGNVESIRPLPRRHAGHFVASALERARRWLMSKH